MHVPLCLRNCAYLFGACTLHIMAPTASLSNAAYLRASTYGAGETIYPGTREYLHWPGCLMSPGPKTSSGRRPTPVLERTTLLSSQSFDSRNCPQYTPCPHAQCPPDHSWTLRIPNKGGAPAMIWASTPQWPQTRTNAALGPSIGWHIYKPNWAVNWPKMAHAKHSPAGRAYCKE